MLPTYESQVPLPSGIQGPSASASAFAGSAANASLLTDGIRDLSRGVGALGGMFGRIEASKKANAEKLQRMEDSLWVGEALQRLNKELTDFSVNPENYSKPTYPNDYLERAMAVRKAAEEAAPSKEAFVALASSFDGAVARQYDDAVGVATKVRMEKATESVTNQIRIATESFRVKNSVDHEAALRDLGHAEADMMKFIDDGLGSIAPKLAAAQKEQVNKEIFSAIVDEEPETAKEYALKANYIDEQTRRAMVKDAERQMAVGQSNGRSAFDEVRAAAVNASRSGEIRSEIPIEQYTMYYGDKAAEVKRSDDIQIKGTNKAVLAFTDVNGKRPDIVQRLVEQANEAAAKTDDPMEQVYASQLAKMYDASMKQRKTDPVQWLVNNHPGLSGVAARYAQDPEDPDNAREYAKTLLKYQGFPPEDASEELEGYYQRLPEHERKLLGKEQARQLASTINNADPGTVVNTIRQAMVMYPGYEALVLRDLVTGDDPIKQEYQLAFSNAGFSFVNDYVSALKNDGPIAKLNDERKADIDAQIRNNPTFMMLAESTLGSYDQSAGQLAGFMNGIASFAALKMNRGMSIKQAVNASVNQLIGTGLGFTRVNGQALALNKYDATGNQVYTDEDITDIGRRLSIALSEIDPREIKVDGFEVAETFKNASPHVKYQAIRDQITGSSFFRMNGDGQSVSLYIKDIYGSPRMVLDSDGTPVVINLSDLPQYVDDVLVPNVSGTPVAQTVKRQPKKTYPLYKESGSTLFGTYSVQTNWPMRPTWIK